jgi:DNA-binding response OmpR family regulator
MRPVGTGLAATVLVVEDDDDCRRLIELALVFDGYRVVGAANGADALRVMNTTPPALVVLDLVLPWVNGIEVLTTMRENARLSAVPVLVVTGTPTQTHELRHLRPVTVLHKPFNIEALAPMAHHLIAATSAPQ